MRQDKTHFTKNFIHSRVSTNGKINTQQIRSYNKFAKPYSQNQANTILKRYGIILGCVELKICCKNILVNEGRLYFFFFH